MSDTDRMYVEPVVDDGDTVELQPVAKAAFDDFVSETRLDLVSLDQHLIDIKAHQARRDKVVLELQAEQRKEHKAAAAHRKRIEKKQDETLALLRLLTTNGSDHG